MNAWDNDLRWHLELVTPPGEEPIDLEFVRDQHLRVANDDAEDDYISRLIRSTRRAAERTTRRALITQDWALVMDRFPCGGCIEVPRPPLQEVLSIKYLDDQGAEQTLNPSVYKVSTPYGPNAQKGRITPAYNEVWPTTRYEIDAVTVTFRAGYVSPTSPPAPNVPEDIVHGMLLMMGELYKIRSESVPSFTGQAAPAIVRAYDLWMPYRVH